jgi:hypothetical protein
MANASILAAFERMWQHITAALSGKADSNHTHAISNVQNLQATLDGKANSSHGNHVPTTQVASNKTFLRNDNTWATVTPANIGASATGHKHTKAEITDFPTSMTPTAHNQAASTITEGTFGGTVMANADYQHPHLRLLRNCSLMSDEVVPNVNGEIIWQYE